MPTATITKPSLTDKQKKILAMSVIGVVVVIVGIGLFWIFQSASSQAGEEAPINVSVQTQDGTSANVSWETGLDTVATVEYGSSADSSSFDGVGFSPTETTSHSVDLTSLDPNTTYYFQIRIGDVVYDNGGAFWTFTTPSETDSTDQTSTDVNLPNIGSATATPSATLQPTPNVTITTTLTPTITSIYSPTPTATISATFTPTPSTASSVCKSNNCNTILNYFGTTCTTADYIRCLKGANVTITQGPTNTPSPTLISATIKSSCSINSFQSNNCTSWIWDDMTTKDKTCSDVFTKYFVQCKGTSWSSTDTASWYCNKTVTSNQLTLPCDNAPTPAPGQAIFCRVRAETAIGGDTNSTDWIYTNSSCSTYSSLSSVSNCQINFLQQNQCGKWSWSLNNPNDPQCTTALNHYFLQCTSNGLFSAPAATTPTPYWYCNKTSTTAYLDMPCDNAITPANGAAITCRVRPEDAQGTDAHAGSWVTTTATCPTSTPTPTPTP